MSEELKPCAHCKSTHAYIMGGDPVRVVCQCGASGPWSRTDQDAIAAWNTRADAQAELDAAIRKAVNAKLDEAAAKVAPMTIKIAGTPYQAGCGQIAAALLAMKEGR